MMKLIFKSKILEDDSKTLDDYAVTEGAAIVVMVQKVSSSYLKNNIWLGQSNQSTRRGGKIR